jgi:flagellar motor protein MotB
LRVKGVADADPLRPEDSEENRAFNRSVSFRPIVHNLL